MATKTYLLTIEESALTGELRTLLEDKGACLHEAPANELHLPPDVEKQVLADLDAFERGDTDSFKSVNTLREELKAYHAKRNANG